MKAKNKSAAVKNKPARFALAVPKNEDQCQQEIKLLRKMKPNIRRFSGFGDDHYAQIDAQLDVLIHDFTEDEIYRKYGHNPDVEHSALDARRWIDGEPNTESPTEGWKPLLTK